MKSDLYIDQNESTVAIPIDNKRNNSILQTIILNLIQFSKKQFVLAVAIIAMAFTFIMQNIAANLGGMVTPVIMHKTQNFIYRNKKRVDSIDHSHLYYL